MSSKAERALKIKICYFLTSTVYLSGLFIFLFKDPIWQKLSPSSVPKDQQENRAMIDMKGYILFQNFLLICVLRLAFMKLPWVWKNVSKFLQFLLMISCVGGLMVYVNPMYINPEPNSVGKMTTLHGEVIDIASYDKQYKLPWLKLLLIGSIAVPMLLVVLLACTVCIVLCVFLKENLKLHRLFPQHFKETRPDKNYENEMLKLKFASTNEDDEEAGEPIIDDEMNE